MPFGLLHGSSTGAPQGHPKQPAPWRALYREASNQTSFPAKMRPKKPSQLPSSHGTPPECGASGAGHTPPPPCADGFSPPPGPGLIPPGTGATPPAGMLAKSPLAGLPPVKQVPLLCLVVGSIRGGWITQTCPAPFRFCRRACPDSPGQEHHPAPAETCPDEGHADALPSGQAYEPIRNTGIKRMREGEETRG